jgi:AraC-like DNA-binding protein
MSPALTPDPTPPDSTGEPAGVAATSAPLATVIVVPPPDDLAPLVEYVWQLVLPEPSPGASWRVVADGYVDIAVRVHLDSEPLRAVATARNHVARRAAIAMLAETPPVVCGAATAARALPMDRPLLVTGVRFRLGAAAGVLRNSPAELVDGARPLGDVLPGRAAGDVWLARAAEAAQRAHGCTGPVPNAPDDHDARVFRALARASMVAAVRRLVARAEARRAPSAPDARVRGALHLLDRAILPVYDGDAAEDDAGAAHVARVCRALGVSKRTLERLFADHLGFAPRSYQRLRRVGAVAEALEHAPSRERRGAESRYARPDTLSDIAHRLGYTDHAHMTREFGRVMGVTPSAYRREALATPVARVLGPVDFERSIPLGTVARRSAA